MTMLVAGASIASSGARAPMSANVLVLIAKVLAFALLARAFGQYTG